MNQNKYQDIVDLFTDQYRNDINKELGNSAVDAVTVQKKIDAGIIDQIVNQHAYALEKSLEATANSKQLNHDERLYVALVDAFGAQITPPYQGQ